MPWLSKSRYWGEGHWFLLCRDLRGASVHRTLKGELQVLRICFEFLVVFFGAKQSRRRHLISSYCTSRQTIYGHSLEGETSRRVGPWADLWKDSSAHIITFHGQLQPFGLLTWAGGSPWLLI